MNVRHLRLPGLVLLLVGVGLIAFGLWESFWAWRSGRWPTVPARIDVFQISRHDRAGSSRSGTPTMFASAEYRYRVDGVDHVGTRVVYGWVAHVDRHQRYRLEAAARAGEPYPIAYAPGNPARSVLFPGWNRGGLITAVVGVVLGSIGAGMFAAARSPGD